MWDIERLYIKNKNPTEILDFEKNMCYYFIQIEKQRKGQDI